MHLKRREKEKNTENWFFYWILCCFLQRRFKVDAINFKIVFHSVLLASLPDNFSLSTYFHSRQLVAKICMRFFDYQIFCSELELVFLSFNYCLTHGLCVCVLCVSISICGWLHINFLLPQYTLQIADIYRANH